MGEDTEGMDEHGDLQRVVWRGFIGLQEEKLHGCRIIGAHHPNSKKYQCAWEIMLITVD